MIIIITSSLPPRCQMMDMVLLLCWGGHGATNYHHNIMVLCIDESIMSALRIARENKVAKAVTCNCNTCNLLRSCVTVFVNLYSGNFICPHVSSSMLLLHANNKRVVITTAALIGYL